MQLGVEITDILTAETPALIVNLFQGVQEPGGATGAVDRQLGGAISQLMADGEIKGAAGEMTLLHTMGRLGPARVLVAGLGPRDELDAAAVRRAAAESVRHLRSRGVSRALTIAHGAGAGGLDPAASGQAIAEGALLGLYRFERHRSPNGKPAAEFDALTIAEQDADKAAALESGVNAGRIMAGAALLARDLVNEPANVLTPSAMAETARQIAEQSGMSLEVFGNEEMREMGMGAFIGVAQGSDEPAKLIVLHYAGDPDNPANNLGLIGKGITFDTGGISLKPAAGMEAMKGDMAGGASVLGAMQAIGQLRPRINVTGMVAATENMPGGKAQRPGDVVRAMNGKTIEIINTDAEGRLVLADVLSLARQRGITRLVDIATLTGAMVTTLGKVCTGVMGNDAPLVNSLIAAGQRAGEKFWELPLFAEYQPLIKSDVADMKNSGGRQAGSISAALLLREFVEGAAWVHLDIAGTATAERAAGPLVKGATGVPARTLVQLTLDLAAQSAPARKRRRKAAATA